MWLIAAKSEVLKYYDLVLEEVICISFNRSIHINMNKKGHE